jgi:hypothetical protein
MHSFLMMLKTKTCHIEEANPSCKIAVVLEWELHSCHKTYQCKLIMSNDYGKLFICILIFLYFVAIKSEVIFIPKTLGNFKLEMHRIFYLKNSYIQSYLFVYFKFSIWAWVHVPTILPEEQVNNKGWITG